MAPSHDPLPARSKASGPPPRTGRHQHRKASNMTTQDYELLSTPPAAIAADLRRDPAAVRQLDGYELTAMLHWAQDEQADDGVYATCYNENLRRETTAGPEFLPCPDSHAECMAT